MAHIQYFLLSMHEFYCCLVVLVEEAELHLGVSKRLLQLEFSFIDLSRPLSQLSHEHLRHDQVAHPLLHLLLGILQLLLLDFQQAWS